ncbi:hypothetical protein GOC72_18635 [Sinorhizobium medicae]|nr:hypothetical protein [Sinorhizobium medicae]
MSSTYYVTKTPKGHWALTHAAPGWITPLGSFPQRKQAVLTARLLAGRGGKVVVK